MVVITMKHFVIAIEDSKLDVFIKEFTQLCKKFSIGGEAYYFNYRLLQD